MVIMWANYNRRRGLTIVELLIVIVVIAILASVVIVAYSGIQRRARDAQRVHDMSVLMKAMESYSTLNGSYPSVCPGGDGSGCPVQTLASELVPSVISVVPNDPKFPYSYYQYVRGSATSYAVYSSDYETKSPCKVGVNMNPGWWGAPACT